MYCMSKNSFWKVPSVLVCIDCWINKISLPYPENVDTLPNLVKYCVDCFSLLFVVSIVLVASPTASSLRQVGGFLESGCCPRVHNKWYQSIPCSTWDHLLIQGHRLLFGGDRVSISERRWDCLWDRVTISELHVDCSRNQFEVEDSFGNSLRVLRGGKDPIFIQFVYLTPFVSALLWGWEDGWRKHVGEIHESTSAEDWCGEV